MSAIQQSALLPAAEAEAPALEDLFVLLADKKWRVRSLQPLLPSILDQAPALHPSARMNWLTGLRTAWQRYAWVFTPSAKTQLLELAARWCDWPLVAAVGEQLQGEGRLDGESAVRLVSAYWRTGDTSRALTSAVNYQLAFPFHHRLAKIHREILGWQSFCEQNGLDMLSGSDEGLVLTPLAPQHCEDFAWQYAAPEIAELCCLPVFASDAQWLEWLGLLYAQANEFAFAIVDPGRGLAGCVHLIAHDGIGLIYYWIGRDFRGHGLAARASRLLLAKAVTQIGIHCCYAKAYADNTPSRRTLEQAGFIDTGICGLPPDDAEVFYRCGDAVSTAALASQLHRILEACESETRAAVLLRR